MKILFIICTLVSAFCLSFNTYANAPSQSLDQIMAVVNDDVITHTELNDAMATVKMQIKQAQQPMPSEKILEKQVLDQLINKNLQLQMAQQAGINITTEELNQAIQRVAQQNQLSVSALYDRLKEEGLSPAEYRHEIREQMTIQKLQQQQLAGKITVTSQEVTHFMQSEAWRANGSKEYHLEDILIPLPDTPSSDEVTAAKKQADSLLTRLKQGSRFSQLAQLESSGKHALQGGDLGWRKLPEIPSAFIEAVSTMKANDIAGPIQTPNGFHLIRLADVRALARQDATPDRKQVESYLLQRKYEEATQNWVSKVRSQAFIKIT